MFGICLLVLVLVLGGGRINTFFSFASWFRYVIFYGILVRTRGNGLWWY